MPTPSIGPLLPSPHPSPSASSKKLPSHIQHFSTPILLLWWPHQPPPPSPRPDIDRMRDCSVGTVQIGPQEGELWCFPYLYAANYTSSSPIFCKSMCTPNQIAPNFTSLLWTPKGIAWCASPAYKLIVALPRSVLPATTKKLPIHLRSHTTPNLLLWWCHQPPLAVLRSKRVENTALEWSILDHKKVRNHVFCVWNENINNSQIHSRAADANQAAVSPIHIFSVQG